MINIEDVKFRGRGYKFPTIDFKFQNTGNATAFMWKFGIKVLEANIDLTPIIGFETTVNAGRFQITADNHGWGNAKSLQIEIEEPSFNQIFPASTLRFSEGSIDSGQSLEVVSLNPEAMDAKQFEIVRTKLTETAKNDEYYNRYSLMDTDSISINSFQAKWECQDEIGKTYSDTVDVRVGNFQSTYFLTAKGFRYEFHSVQACMAESDVTYITILDPLNGLSEVSYPISRKIPVGDIERFHIMVGTEMSCHLKLQFSFYIDKDHSIDSDIFDVNIWNPRNSRWRWDYEDGAELIRKSTQQEGEYHGFGRETNRAEFPFLSDKSESYW